MNAIPEDARDEDRDPMYAQYLAQGWVELLSQMDGGASQKNMAFLMKDVVPILVEGLQELQKVQQQETEKEEAHRKYMKHNPSAKARRPFNPLHWLSSFLMRHNPRFTKTDSPAIQAYGDSIRNMTT
jgi:hypothetical protein